MKAGGESYWLRLKGRDPLIFLYFLPAVAIGWSRWGPVPGEEKRSLDISPLDPTHSLRYGLTLPRDSTLCTRRGGLAQFLLLLSLRLLPPLSLFLLFSFLFLTPYSHHRNRKDLIEYDKWSLIGRCAYVGWFSKQIF